VRERKANPNGDYSKTLLEFAAAQNPPFQYLKDFTPESVADFEGSWKVKGRALQVQHERLKQFFKSCHDLEVDSRKPGSEAETAQGDLGAGVRLPEGRS
jgi:hypothetical protein